MESNKSNLAGEVYNYFLDQLFQQKLTQGQKIPEGELCKILNVSRTPVREAVQRLQAEGLLESSPNHVACIATIDEDARQQLGVVRLQLESLTAQLACFYGSNADFAKLKKINFELAQAVKEKDIATALRKDMEFHNTYIAITHNEMLARCQNQLTLRIMLLMATETASNPHHMDHSAVDHANMLEALYERDVKKTLSCIISHISTFYGLDANIYSLMITDFDQPGQYRQN